MPPQSDHASEQNEQAIADLRRRIKRVSRWRLFFLLVMPVGFIVPCGLALSLRPGTNQPPPQGITAPQIFGMLAFGLPIIGLAGYMLMAGDKSKYRTSLAVAEQADEMGLQFSEQPSDDLLALLKDFRLFSGAKHQGGWNCCSGKDAKTRFTLLEYSVAYRGGLLGPRDVRLYRQTVVVLFGLNLPDFRVGPKSWLDKLSRLFGGSFVELPGQEQFNKSFSLSAEKPVQIKAALSSRAINLLQEAKVTVEICGGNMVCYRHNEIAKPKAYSEFIKEAVRIAQAFQTPA
jgi:hypothetical protein